MSGDGDRVVHGLRLRIDRELCVGFGDCVAEAPAAFTLDEGGIVVFAEPEGADRAALIRAAECCPVDAITVFDDGGRQIAP